MLTYKGTTRAGRHRWHQDGYNEQTRCYHQGALAYRLYLDQPDHDRLLAADPQLRIDLARQMAVAPDYRDCVRDKHRIQ